MDEKHITKLKRVLICADKSASVVTNECFNDFMKKYAEEINKYADTNKYNTTVALFGQTIIKTTVTEWRSIPDRLPALFNNTNFILTLKELCFQNDNPNSTVSNRRVNNFTYNNTFELVSNSTVNNPITSISSVSNPFEIVSNPTESNTFELVSIPSVSNTFELVFNSTESNPAVSNTFEIVSNPKDINQDNSSKLVSNPINISEKPYDIFILLTDAEIYSNDAALITQFQIPKYFMPKKVIAFFFNTKDANLDSMLRTKFGDRYNSHWNAYSKSEKEVAEKVFGTDSISLGTSEDKIEDISNQLTILLSTEESLFSNFQQINLLMSKLKDTKEVIQHVGQYMKHVYYKLDCKNQVFTSDQCKEINMIMNLVAQKVSNESFNSCSNSFVYLKPSDNDDDDIPPCSTATCDEKPIAPCSFSTDPVIIKLDENFTVKISSDHSVMENDSNMTDLIKQINLNEFSSSFMNDLEHFKVQSIYFYIYKPIRFCDLSSKTKTLKYLDSTICPMPWYGFSPNGNHKNMDSSVLMRFIKSKPFYKISLNWFSKLYTCTKIMTNQDSSLEEQFFKSFLYMYLISKLESVGIDSTILRSNFEFGLKHIRVEKEFSTVLENWNIPYSQKSSLRDVLIKKGFTNVDDFTTTYNSKTPVKLIYDLLNTPEDD